MWVLRDNSRPGLILCYDFGEHAQRSLVTFRSYRILQVDNGSYFLTGAIGAIAPSERDVKISAECRDVVAIQVTDEAECGRDSAKAVVDVWFKDDARTLVRPL
jgi:hypothetical protein